MDEALASRPAWCLCNHAVEQARGRGSAAFPARDGGGQGDRYRTGATLRVNMGGVGRRRRMLDDGDEIVREVRPHGRDPHGGAVSHRALPVEDTRGDDRPVLPLVEGLQDAVRAAAIAATGLGPVAPCEHDRERVAVDRAVPIEHFADAEGHGRVVRPAPRARWQGALLDEALDRRGRYEEALTEGVADAQALQCAEGASHAVGMVREGRHRRECSSRWIASRVRTAATTRAREACRVA